MMNSKKSTNQITEIVRLQQILNKWKKLAINAHAKNTRRSILGTTTPASAAAATIVTPSSNQISKTSNINKFLKKTLSFSETSPSSSSSSSDHVRIVVPKGYLAVCVGKEELKRFVIPMEYLGHQAFALLLREAEEEFGFQQEGVLQIPCEVQVFENILKMMESGSSSKKKASADAFVFRFHDYTTNAGGSGGDHHQSAAAAANSNRYCCSPPLPPPIPPPLPLPECKHHQQQPPQMCR